MSDDDDEDEIPITLKYHGIQKKIDFNFDFNVLLGEAFERFKIDKTKYELRFYYYDEDILEAEYHVSTSNWVWEQV